MGFGLNNFLAGVGMNDRAMLQAQQDLANQQILQARADQATQENPSAIQAGIASNNATAAQGNLTAGTTNASVPGAIATAGQKSDIQTSAAQQFAPYVDQAGSAVAKANLNNYGAGVSGSQAQLYGAQAQALSQEAALNSTPVTIAANNLAQSGDLGSRRAAAAFQAYRPLIDPNNPNVSASVEALKNLQSTGALDAAFPGHQLDPNSEVADIKISGQPGARTFQIIEKDSGGNLKPVGSPIPEAWFQDATHQVLAAANESKVIKPGETVGTFNPRTGQFSTGYTAPDYEGIRPTDGGPATIFNKTTGNSALGPSVGGIGLSPQQQKVFQNLAAEIDRTMPTNVGGTGIDPAAIPLRNAALRALEQNLQQGMLPAQALENAQRVAAARNATPGQLDQMQIQPGITSGNTFVPGVAPPTPSGAGQAPAQFQNPNPWASFYTK